MHPGGRNANKPVLFQFVPGPFYIDFLAHPHGLINIQSLARCLRDQQVPGEQRLNLMRDTPISSQVGLIVTQTDPTRKAF
jgi:hypothetical protein